MVSNSLLWAGIHALAALGARHQRFSLADAFFVQGKSGTILDASHEFLHFSVSMRTSKILILFVSDWEAAKGQKSPHWVRRLVNTGRMITSKMKRDAKMIVCSKILKEVICTNSVTALKTLTR